jgi:LytS/YehU family sensor histidine kinase
LFSIGFYQYSFQYLLPKAYNKKKPLLYYIGQSLLLLLISIIPVGLLAALFLYDAEISVPIVLFNGLFQLLITVPFSWEVYKREVRSKQAFTNLKKEADQSAANVQMLRSQINPHFLFNILNTLYGTAIQEKAERTAEGVQMLGDMMRFMLHENLKEKILLTRELEYIRNYIYLQSLRINQSPTVAIKTEIEDYQGEATIAPMLLIPFIENAFKHGISLREASFIIVILKASSEEVVLEVSNSTHTKLTSDTEADKSGIGLENVKQRLALSYPESHKLDIQEALGKHKVKLEIDLK